MICFITIGACYSFVILAATTRFYDNVPAEGSNLAYGFADSGCAIGMIFLPILTEYLREIYGWRGAILLLAGIGSHLSIYIALMKETQLENDNTLKSRYQEDYTSDDDFSEIVT